jgi:hypothetical protein
MTRRRWLIVSAASGIFLAVAADAVAFLKMLLTLYDLDLAPAFPPREATEAFTARERWALAKIRASISR